MGPLAALGGIHIPGGVVRGLEQELGGLCTRYGFPAGEEFKWSPSRGSWQFANLIDPQRSQFRADVLNLLADRSARAIVVLEDISKSRATGASSSLMDLARLFLERVDNQLSAAGQDGIVIFDSPGEGKVTNAFLSECLAILQRGTAYVRPRRIAVNVLSTDSKMMRLLQAADLITSCTTAAVSGERFFAPPLFRIIVNRLLHRAGGRIGGVGLKLHPDHRYVNLYHWLLGDHQYWKGGTGMNLPSPSHPYATSPDKP